MSGLLVFLLCVRISNVSESKVYFIKEVLHALAGLSAEVVIFGCGIERENDISGSVGFEDGERSSGDIDEGNCGS